MLFGDYIINILRRKNSKKRNKNANKKYKNKNKSIN